MATGTRSALATGQSKLRVSIQANNKLRRYGPRITKRQTVAVWVTDSRNESAFAWPTAKLCKASA